MPILKLCPQCEKKKLAFLLNSEGICNSCAAENHAAEIRQAENERIAGLYAAANLYAELAQTWKSIDTRSVYPKYRSIDHAQATVSNCNRFLELLHKIPEHPYFNEEFAAHCYSLNADSCLNEDFGRMEVTQVDQATLKINFEQLIPGINHTLTSAEKFLKNSEEFKNHLAQLSFVEIQIDEQALQVEKESSSIFESKNITSRTRIDRLNPFFVVDVETTGLNPVADEIISLSAIKFVNFEPVEAFTTFVKPRNGLKPRAQAINGITESDVCNAPYIESIAEAFKHFITPDLAAKNYPPIVGHNLSFDYSFLLANGINTLCFTRPHYDTLELSRREYKYQDSYKLDSLVSNILYISRDTSHHSLSDALAAGLLFKQICKNRIGF